MPDDAVAQPIELDDVTVEFTAPFENAVASVADELDGPIHAAGQAM